MHVPHRGVPCSRDRGRGIGILKLALSLLLGSTSVVSDQSHAGQPSVDTVDQPDPEPREECGVFGVWAPGEEVAKLTYYGLYALQHRGQEAAGISVSDGKQIVVFKDLGLVSQVFDEQILQSLQGYVAVGHCRYSTTGATIWENAQPIFRTTATGSGLSFAHNGNLVNTAELRQRTIDPGLQPHGQLTGSSSDSDLVCGLVGADAA